MITGETPRGSRIDRKKEETKQKIITIAIELFHRQGFDATTMEQIANEVDIAKGTLYNYFPVKEAIISEYIERASQANHDERVLQVRILPDTRSRLVCILTQLIEGVRRQKEIFEKFFTYRIKGLLSLHPDNGQPPLFRSLAAEIIELGQQAGEIRQDMPLDVLLDLFEFALIEVVKRFYAEPETCDVYVAIEQCVNLFINGAQKPAQELAEGHPSRFVN